MASILIPPQIQFIDGNGEPLVGGKVYTYEAGMDPIPANYKTSWKDQQEITANTNPVILDDDGRAEIWINGSYKIIVNDANDVLIYTADNVISYSDADFTGLIATVADLNTTAAIAEIFTTDQSPVLADRSKVFLMDASSSSKNVNLPLISSLITASNKYRITIKKIDKSVNYVDLNPSGIQKVDGRSYFRLYDYGDFVELIPDGSNWNVVASKIRGTIITKSSDFSVNLEDDGCHFNCKATTAPIYVLLPAISDVAKGFNISFKKIDASVNSIIILPDAADLIDGAYQLVILVKNEGSSIKTDGVNWFITNQFKSSGTFTTLDVKATFKTSEDGWVRMDDGTIGNTVSGATTRANEDTKDLFVGLYLRISDTWCPVSGGRSGVTEADAINDFNNGKTLRIPQSLGRAMCNYGNGSGLSSRVLGEYIGVEDVSITIAKLAPHYHAYRRIWKPPPDTANKIGDKGDFNSYSDARLTGNAQNSAGTISANGDPLQNMQPSIFINFLIKL